MCGPPCAAMTVFILSTTSCTLSVSVPSRSQRTAPTRGRRSGLAAAAARRGANGLGDRERDLLGDAAIARLLAPSHQRRELVVEGVDVRGTRIHDLEAQIAQRIALGESLEDHLTDSLRRDLGETALPEAGLEIFDQAADLIGAERFGRRLFDRARKLASIELLPAAIPLEHLDPRRLASLERRETLLAAITDAPAADRGPVLRLARIDDAGVGIATAGAAHGHKIWEEGLLNLVAGVKRKAVPAVSAGTAGSPERARGVGASPHDGFSARPRAGTEG